MAELEFKRLLLIGVDVANLACSARRAGCEVYAVDYFGDQDLRSASDDVFSIAEQREGGSCGRLSADFDAEDLLRGAEKISVKHPIDGVLLSTGLDDSPEILSELAEIAPIVGNSPDSIRKIRDRKRFFSELNRLGVSFPETVVADDFSEASRASKNIGYPVLVKPVKGFGGSGIKKAENLPELGGIFKGFSHTSQRAVIQEYVPGIAASASVVSSRRESVTLTVNEQLIGSSTSKCVEPFGYSGNIVPLSMTEDILSTFKVLAERIITHFGLVGSNGVDFVISREGVPYVVEVNPRFQGTLECVENVLGINMVKTHLDACKKGILPKIPALIPKFCTRLILSASRRSVVPDLSVHPEVRDVPFPGVIVEKGEPICSIIAEGKDRDSSLGKARVLAETVSKSLKPIQ